MAPKAATPAAPGRRGSPPAGAENAKAAQANAQGHQGTADAANRGADASAKLAGKLARNAA